MATRTKFPRIAVVAVLAASFVVLAPYGILESLLAALVATCCISEDNLAAPFLTARRVVLIVVVAGTRTSISIVAGLIRRVPSYASRSSSPPSIPRRST